MSKIRCGCGHVIVDIESPLHEKYLGIPDGKVWDLIKELTNSKMSAHPTDDVSAILLDYSFEFLKCPECGRLLIFWDAEDPQCVSYIPESD